MFSSHKICLFGVFNTSFALLSVTFYVCVMCISDESKFYKHQQCNKNKLFRDSGEAVRQMFFTKLDAHSFVGFQSGYMIVVNVKIKKKQFFVSDICNVNNVKQYIATRFFYRNKRKYYK